MPYPELIVSPTALRDSGADALVLALPPLEHAGEILADWPGLEDSLRGIGFTGVVGNTARAFAPQSTSTPIIAVGTGSAPDAAALRDAIGAAVRTAVGFAELAVAAPAADGLWRAAAEGAVLGGYRFAGYKTTDAAKKRASRVTVHTAEDVDAGAAEEISAVGGAVALVKDLVHIPAEWLGPADLADRAAEEVAGLPIDVEILDEGALAEGGFGGILGVGQGSDRPPRLVRLSYAPEGASRHVAVVGKGITFDTGGVSLKPAAEMDEMKFDMCGAASVLGVFRALGEIQPAINVVGLIPSCENMNDGHAIKPGDVLTSMSGQTVEVLNTDAEGRLILCDALTYAKRFEPAAVIDIATLTGACVIALGAVRSGLFSTDDALAAALQSAGDSALDRCWRLPLDDEYGEGLKSNFADMANIAGRAAGAVTAAKFLQKFVGDAPWAHLDIAGTAWKSGAAKGSTGRPVGLLVKYLLDRAAGSAGSGRSAAGKSARAAKKAAA